jgi:tetratricopeptide (TPR) repeat protein
MSGESKFMATDVVVPFIMYVTFFRLAIVTAGIVSIVLGYRLFCKGVWPNSGGEGSTVNASFAGQSFTVKNAAPGTCFALFGVIIISTMLATSPPELSQAVSGEIKVRGSPKVQPLISEMPTDRLQERLGEAVRAYRSQREFKGADALFDKIRTDLTTSIDHVALLYNELALRYLEEAQNDKAMTHVQIAVVLKPEDSDYIDTLIQVTCKTKGPEVALKYLTELSGSHRAGHEKWRKPLEGGSCRRA